MSQNEQQICPWCQMEIIWDPEFGPEEECPHCLNELKEYRSLPLDVEPVIEADIGEVIEEEDEDDYEALLEETKGKDKYHEGVMQCLDTQIEVPECFRCQELMLLAGVQTIDSNRFVPEIPASLGRSFLPKSFNLQLYVCPSCFTTESMLSVDSRDLMVKIIKGSE
jgi:hypothetical protein